MKLLIAKICFTLFGWMIMMCIGLNLSNWEKGGSNSVGWFAIILWTILWIGIALLVIW